MKRFITLISVLCLALSGCSNGIPRTEYDALQAKYSDVEKENKALQTEKADIEAKYNEYFNLYGELLADSTDKEFIGAWGKVVYGDNIEYSQFSDNTVQLNVIEDDITYDSIKDFYDKLSNNAPTLATMTNGIDSIYVKLIDSGGNPVIEFFINQSDMDDLDISASIGIKYYDDAAAVFNDLP